MTRFFILLTALTLTTAVFADEPAKESREKAFPSLNEEKLLPNGHRIDDHLLSGAQPEGEEAFKKLAELGVKTIISVDGSKPDVETAKKYGLRYVHLPIGYDDVTADEGKAIAKAIEELPGPVYVHCHHGKHRSATAVAVACVVSGRIKPEQAELVLETFGTGKNYKGLWASARNAKPLEAGALASLNVEFPETKTIPPMADAMVHIDQTFDRIKAIQKAGWRAPKDHPDLDPPHEALQLREKLHELRRTDEVQKHPEGFRKMLAENEQAAQQLEDALRDWIKSGATSAPPDDITKAFKATSASCVACHKAYRDESAVK